MEFKYDGFSLIIDNKKFDFNTLFDQIDDLIKQSQTDWEKELFSFINDWHSSADYIIINTSGSTGIPKSIKLPKKVMWQSALRTIAYFDLKNSDKLLLNLSCSFIAGKMMVVRALAGKTNLKVVAPTTNFSFLENETFDFGAMVPNQVQKILENKNGKTLLQNIKNLIVGGSSIDTALCSQIENLTNRIVSTYGMTETASHVALRELTGKFKSEYYTCLSDIKVTLNNKDCLVFKIPEFNEIIETNDIGSLISQNSFKIIGRADSVINSGGIKFMPEVIENKLSIITKRRLVITSKPDTKLGERIVLVIEGNNSKKLTGEILKAEFLDAYEIPKEIFYLKNFPETKNGKIKRNEIKKIISEIR